MISKLSSLSYCLDHYSRFGEAIVLLNIRDINNKPPEFGDDFDRTIYVQESTSVGEVVVQLTANDDDINADLEFDIVEPIRARDKTGNILTNRAAYNFGKAFRIDPESGEIRINEPLSYNSAAVIVITVKVEVIYTTYLISNGGLFLIFVIKDVTS